MMPVLLTDRERDRVIGWLKSEAAQANAIAEQMEKLPSAASAPMQQMIEHERAYGAACLLILIKQRSYEQQDLKQQDLM